MNCIVYYLYFRYTKRDDAVYAIVLDWPVEGFVRLNSIRLGQNRQVTLLGFDGSLIAEQSGNTVVVKFPEQIKVKSQWAFTLKFMGVLN